MSPNSPNVYIQAEREKSSAFEAGQRDGYLGQHSRAGAYDYGDVRDAYMRGFEKGHEDRQKRNSQ